MTQYLYSIILEMSAINDATLPATMGHQGHALFLDLNTGFHPSLATRLHSELDYTPFTLSPIKGAKERDKQLLLEGGQTYRLRITLLDGGTLWQCLSQQFLQAPKLSLELGKASFMLTRVISTPSADPTGWASYTDWQTLASTPAQSSITMHFASPTAFSMGERHFILFPEPALLWHSLLRSWNRYAPACLQMDKQAVREFRTNNVVISDYDLHTTTLHFPKYSQKGFVGSCTYQVKTDDAYTSHITALASFARYAGIGYKTTMGMGSGTNILTPSINSLLRGLQAISVWFDLIDRQQW